MKKRRRPMKMAQLKRKRTIDGILRLLPPRADNAESAAANLASRDDESLTALFQELEIAATHFRANNNPTSDQARATRRALADAKVASGLTKLAAATQRLAGDNASVPPEKQPTDEIAVLPLSYIGLSAGDIGLSAAQAIAIHTSPAAPELAETEPTEQWAPLLLEPSVPDTIRRRSTRPAAAKRNKAESSVHPSHVVVVDDSVLEIARVQELVTRQFSNLARKVIDDEWTIDRANKVFSAMMKESILKKYLEMHAATLLRDVLSMVFDPEKQPVGFGLDAADWELFQSLRRHWRTPSTVTEPAFLRAASGNMAELDVISGLSRMVAKTRQYDPDLIVSLSGGGTIVGDLIRNISPIGSATFGIMDRGDFSVNCSSRPGNPRRILLINDISQSGNTLITGLQVCRTLFHGASVHAIALLGTTESAAKLGDVAFFSCVTRSASTDVPWDRSGRYANTKKEHILGANTNSSFTIQKGLLARSIEQH